MSNSNNLIAKHNRKTYYVYALIDPRDNTTFYIGKGCGKRISAHSKEVKSGKINNVKKYKIIKSILENGLTVIEKIIKNNLSEKRAFALEKQLILSMKHKLTNISYGVSKNNEICIAKFDLLISKIKPFDDWVNSIQDEEKQLVSKVFGDCKKFYDWYFKIISVTKEKELALHGDNL
jgi:hypothetical protein